MKNLLFLILIIVILITSGCMGGSQNTVQEKDTTTKPVTIIATPNPTTSGGNIGAITEVLVTSTDTEVIVNSSPTGAKVIIDNKLFGTTPIKLKGTNQGYHRLIMMMDGYDDYYSTIYVVINQTVFVNGILKPSTKPSYQVTSKAPTSTSAIARMK